MTTGLTYSTYQTQVAQLAVVPVNDTNFQAILPMMITYAENRDLVRARGRDGISGAGIF